jgi:hypothetical protein
MKKISDGNKDIWLSVDAARDFRLKRIDEVLVFVEYFLNHLNSKERKYMELYGEKMGRPRIAVLFAHGGPNTSMLDWCYWDEGQGHSIANWIAKREVEGYGTAVLISCNPMAVTPQVRDMLLVLPDNDYGELCDVHVDLYHPREGDLQHIIEYELARLKKMRKRTPK